MTAAAAGSARNSYDWQPAPSPPPAHPLFTSKPRGAIVRTVGPTPRGAPAPGAAGPCGRSGTEIIRDPPGPGRQHPTQAVNVAGSGVCVEVGCGVVGEPGHCGRLEAEGRRRLARAKRRVAQA